LLHTGTSERIWQFYKFCKKRTPRSLISQKMVFKEILDQYKENFFFPQIFVVGPFGA
jgi:hypothetical protein